VQIPAWPRNGFQNEGAFVATPQRASRVRNIRETARNGAKRRETAAVQPANI